MKLVCVDWIDSCSGRGWRDLGWYENDDGSLKCRSVGYLVRESRTDVWLVAHLAGDKNGMDQACGDMCIPKVAITKIQALKEPRK